MSIYWLLVHSFLRRSAGRRHGRDIKDIVLAKRHRIGHSVDIISSANVCRLRWQRSAAGVSHIPDNALNQELKAVLCYGIIHIAAIGEIGIVAINGANIIASAARPSLQELLRAMGGEVMYQLLSAARQSTTPFCASA